MGGCVVRNHIYEAFQGGPDHVIDLFHGYTYSGHPLAAAAALATLDLYRDEGLFERSKEMEPKMAAATIAFSPPLIAEEKHLEEAFDKFRRTLDKVA